ncbi:amidase [Nocardia sp. BSTN01]|uniref:amidase n=1 Tax=Nocardia sp. BSTN01 TaxID=2783665 RepID=UPI00188F8564|nr:amidase [Nocardia sp. BSTN01]MBF4998660.1 amidase [Nocardia sp. BSTN01]
MSSGERGGASGGLRALAADLACGSISSRDAVAVALDRIEASRNSLNAFRLIRREPATAEAWEADQRLSAGERRPLLGVPIAVKDDVDVAGSPTSFGCGGTFAPETQDSEVVRRLRAAGAVIVGKTNTPELGQWPFTSAPAFGYTVNPWNRAHTPGGSSGGSAAAVAAGLVPAAIGSDGGGSIRIPVSWTNLVGIKPQRGRVPTDPAREPFNGLTVFGPLARTVGDAALLFDVIARPLTAGSAGLPPASLSDAVGADPGRLRIALSLRPAFTGAAVGLHPDVEAGIRRVADRLCGLGHSVELAEPTFGPLLTLSMVARIVPGVRQRLRALPAAQVDPRTTAKARWGAALSGPACRSARAVEPLLRHRVGRIFSRFDLVLSPTTAQPPPPIGVVDGLSMAETDRIVLGTIQYTFPWNVLGWPAVGFPAGFTAAGLPFGAQLLRPACSERMLVSVAAQLEAQSRWDTIVPTPWW